jgi:hypothetical protein
MTRKEPGVGEHEIARALLACVSELKKRSRCSSWWNDDELFKLLDNDHGSLRDAIAAAENIIEEGGGDG